jgi:hypothetical protein
MSRTNRGSKGPGFEYWSGRLKAYFLDPGRYNKTRTHRSERRTARDDIEQGLKEVREGKYAEDPPNVEEDLKQMDP